MTETTTEPAEPSRIYYGFRNGAEIVIGVLTVGPGGGPPVSIEELTHYPSHSPTGFEWGYQGSGPADLAFSILAHYFKEEYEVVNYTRQAVDPAKVRALEIYVPFKNLIIANLPANEWALTETAVRRAVQRIDIARSDQASLDI